MNPSNSDAKATFNALKYRVNLHTDAIERLDSQLSPNVMEALDHEFGHAIDAITGNHKLPSVSKILNSSLGLWLGSSMLFNAPGEFMPLKIMGGVLVFLAGSTLYLGAVAEKRLTREKFFMQPYEKDVHTTFIGWLTGKMSDYCLYSHPLYHGGNTNRAVQERFAVSFSRMLTPKPDFADHEAAWPATAPIMKEVFSLVSAQHERTALIKRRLQHRGIVI